MESFDVVIVGGGPAGLSAALILGRCRRRVLVCDSGHYRNAASHGLHGFLTRDGTEPLEFLQIARKQLLPYPSVRLQQIEVTDATGSNNGFLLTIGQNTRVTSRKLLVATGVVDHLPNIEGLASLYGRSVFHCPYCDGWEMRDRALGIYGRGQQALGLALELTLWSRDLILFTDGASGFTPEDFDRLRSRQVQIHEEKIVRLAGINGKLQRIVLANNDAIARDAMFFSTGQHQASNLPEQLGCTITEQGCVETGDYESTAVPGLYVAGDASRLVQLAIVAASEGAQAAFAINKELLREDLAR
ncbi:MAG: NAD(P)/FAD-dependent oxidoreductase [Pyrinomonadaceae bacterium]